MVTQVDFYIIDAKDLNGRDHFMCRLINKAYLKKHQVLVLCKDQNSANRIDEALWTYDDESFVPHNLITEGPKYPPPIQISSGEVPTQHRDILVNLTGVFPEQVKQFKRVIEIVYQDEAVRVNSRELFKSYRQAGFKVNTHNLVAEAVR